MIQIGAARANAEQRPSGYQEVVKQFGAQQQNMLASEANQVELEVGLVGAAGRIVGSL